MAIKNSILFFPFFVATEKIEILVPTRLPEKSLSTHPCWPHSLSSKLSLHRALCRDCPTLLQPPPHSPHATAAPFASTSSVVVTVHRRHGPLCHRPPPVTSGWPLEPLVATSSRRCASSSAPDHLSHMPGPGLPLLWSSCTATIESHATDLYPSPVVDRSGPSLPHLPMAGTAQPPITRSHPWPPVTRAPCSSACHRRPAGTSDPN
jgi:hypothetical protein